MTLPSSATRKKRRASDFSRVARGKLGKQLKAMRLERTWSRPYLLDKYHRVWENADSDYEIRGEAWLARVERGDTIILSPLELAFLCQALGCNLTERLKIYAYAGYNMLANDSGELTPVAAALSHIMMELNNNSTFNTMFDQLLQSRHIDTLSTENLIEIFLEAVRFIKIPS